MNKQWWMFPARLGLLGAALVFAAGCKPATCESVCEGLNGCEGKTPTPDCQAYCDDTLQSAKDTACDDEYDALLSCQGAINICASDTFCAAQSGVFFKCVSDACTADPSKC